MHRQTDERATASSLRLIKITLSININGDFDPDLIAGPGLNLDRDCRHNFGNDSNLHDTSYSYIIWEICERFYRHFPHNKRN